MQQPALPPLRVAGVPSEAVWNDEIKAAWTSAYSSASPEPADYDVEIEGTIPPTLRGTVFRNGPGNFERGGQRFKHVLDGDGLLCRFSIDGTTGRARFASRFVETPAFVAERAADEVLHRNTFGTQPEHEGPLGDVRANAFNLALKNPANTNVQLIGGKLLALWEAALPCVIDPLTLTYEGRETFDGLMPPGELTVTSGVGELDKTLGFGVAFTAHPREDRKRGRTVGWSWAAPMVGDELAVTIHEWRTASGELVHSKQISLPSAIAPHDFAITDSWYIFALNAMELKLLPYVLGLVGPVGALCTTGEEVVLRLVPRPDGPHAHREPLTVHTRDAYFAIHHAVAFDEPPSGADDAAEADDGTAAAETRGSEAVRLYTAAWPTAEKGPFLGDWGGAVPYYDEGKISPTLLLSFRIDTSEGGAAVVEREYVAAGACIDHPHVDPRFEGDARVRYVYMSWCNTEGESGSPPVGWCRWDRQTGESIIWHAPPRTFCEEVVVIPRPRDGDEAVPAADEADVWVAAMMFDADSGRSSLAILDGDNFAAGPVCRLWIKSNIPHGLHGCFTNELYGL